MTDIPAAETGSGREKKKTGSRKGNAAHRPSPDSRNAETDSDLIKTVLEKERGELSGILEQVKQQSELLVKILDRAPANPAGIKDVHEANAGFVSELVGYHALRRLAADITRRVGSYVGQGSDVRILILDRLDYAAGDIPLVEMTSQLSVFDVRCRKQITANKELADNAAPEQDYKGAEGRAAVVKTGTTRLAALTIPPGIDGAGIPFVSSPAAAGLPGAVAGIAGSCPPDIFQGSQGAVKTGSLIAAVAGSLRSDKRFVYVYNHYSLDTTGPQSRLMNMYTGVLDCSSRLAQSQNRLRYLIIRKNREITELETALEERDPDSVTPVEEQDRDTIMVQIKQERSWIDRAGMEILASDAIHAELRDFVRTATSETSGQPASMMAQAVFREKVHELGITHLLSLCVHSSGGELVTKKGLLGTGATSYLGGAVVSYVLSRVEGEILGSEILPLLYSFGFDPAGQRYSPLKQIRFDKQDLKR